ncbi:histidine phosphotransferase ChpT [Rhodobium orientis]|uniref:Histidine phosphotransferase n=1 Tax=Rhodobium orientis TaxID=34017 RepID=A0A327JUY1_9HYPH|nr:histidine phosphotransferase family protein [Rhodobium orientis]MBB4303051.1 histidine phosphotransferase ChpT [Rhodobium orientis]MBK5947986.1 histidine phosphotransferase [Rhodobium orientis]RAI29395.1 histidine phosphotransferase [Rhodobium orientis]
MAQSDDISAIDLGALLCSRVCHDIISPVGAINNGLEVLDEGGAEEMQEFAMDLIRKSAVQASAKLQFARIAFGAAGSAGAEVDIGDAQKVADGYMAGEKATLTWTGERVLMAKNRVKLLLNLLLVANSMIPRGGTIDFSITGPADAPVFRYLIKGTGLRVPEPLGGQLSGEVEPDGLTAHEIQPVYTGMLARACATAITWDVAEGEIVLTAQPA